jgi:hypothetical protein
MTKQSLTPKDAGPEVVDLKASTSSSAIPVTEPAIEPAIELERVAAADVAAHPLRLRRSELVKYILLLFVSSRIVLSAIGLTARLFLDNGFGKQGQWSKYPWLDLWGVWDSFWYMNIVQNGYSTSSVLSAYPDQTNFPFFPLYPILMRGLFFRRFDHL